MTELKPIEMTTVQVRDRTPWWRKALKRLGIRTGIYRYTIAPDIIERNEYVKDGVLVADYADPPRGPSTIIFVWNADEGLVLYQANDGDAYFEIESGTLDVWLKEAVEAEFDSATGWYVAEGFTMHYWRDEYTGEHDGTASMDVLRRATWRDYSKLGWHEGGPWFVKLMARTGLRMPAWWPEP